MKTEFEVKILEINIHEIILKLNLSGAKKIREKREKILFMILLQKEKNIG